MANPLGKEKVKKPNIKGIIHNIILLVEDWRGSAVGIVVIFCCTHIDAPTRTGRMGEVKGLESGRPRLSQRKRLFSGTSSCTQGSHV